MGSHIGRGGPGAHRRSPRPADIFFGNSGDIRRLFFPRSGGIRLLRLGL